VAGDLNYTNVTIMESPRSLIVGVISARAAAKGMEQAAEGAVAPAAEGAAAPAAAPVAEAKK